MGNLPNIKLPEMESPESKPMALKLPRQRGMSFTYWLARTICGVFFCIFFKFRILGTKNIPTRGAYLLAANHASYFDPPIISGMTPTPLYFFGRKSLIQNLWLRVLYRGINVIPVDTEGADPAAIRTAIGVLKDNCPLVVFPEGTRSPDGNFQPAKPGAGFLACATQVPVVPVRIFGSFEALNRHTTKPKWGMPITVVIGKPIAPAEYDAGKKDSARYQKAADKFMEVIGKIEKPAGHTQREIEWAF